jgi:DNA-binding transcriptional LysR family regulator
MAQILQGFRKLHPDCQIQLSDLTPAPLMEALGQGLLDGAFIGASPHTLPRKLDAFVWKQEPLLIALPETHPLAGSKTLPLGQLRSEGWVMVSREAAPAFRRQFEELCRKADFQPRVVQESERVAAVLTMVIASQGISLLPESVSRVISSGVVFRPIEGRPAPSLDHTFLFHRKSVSPELRAFVSLLMSAF